MRKPNVIFSIIAMISFAGTAIAFKNTKGNSSFTYRYDANFTDGLACTIEVPGYLYATPKIGSIYAFIDTNGNSNCETIAFLVLNSN